MNNPDLISESLETIFAKQFLGLILKFFDADPGSGMEKIRIREKHKHPGTATLVEFVNYFNIGYFRFYHF
jgi:hypothetical protein